MTLRPPAHGDAAAPLLGVRLAAFDSTPASHRFSFQSNVPFDHRMLGILRPPFDPGARPWVTLAKVGAFEVMTNPTTVAVD